MDGLNKSMYEIGSDSAFSILARSNQLLSIGKDVINLGIGHMKVCYILISLITYLHQINKIY